MHSKLTNGVQMTFDEFRDEMNAHWQSTDKEARSRKDPHISLERLIALYGKFDADERRMADQVLTEWVLSEDEGLRFDARVLIDHQKIIVAIPALEERAKALTSIATPGAPFELQAINCLLKKLGGDACRIVGDR